MTPRAAVFVFHDVVPAVRLGEVPVEHRPYSLASEELRAFLLAASTSARRAVPAGDVPEELAGLFYGLTFDDGHASDYTDAFPMLQELGLRATFFVVPTLVDTPGYVTWGQLREMVAAGMEAGSHSLTHPFVDRLDRAGLEREFGESKTIIRNAWARPCAPPRCRAAGLRRGSSPYSLPSATACSAPAAPAGGIPATRRSPCRAWRRRAACRSRPSRRSSRPSRGPSGVCR